MSNDHECEIDKYAGRLAALTLLEHAEAGRFAECDELINATEDCELFTGLVHVSGVLLAALKDVTNSDTATIIRWLRRSAHQGVT